MMTLKARAVASLALSALLLGGCTTTLRSSGLPYQTKRVPDLIPAGFAYQLPVAQVTPEAFLTIKSCEVDKTILSKVKDIHKAKIEPPLTEVKVATGGSITTAFVGGPRVVIDYRRLAAFLKTGHIEIERYPNGTLKSINAGIADESPEAIASVAAAAATVYSLSIGAPVAATAIVSGAVLTTSSAGAKMVPNVLEMQLFQKANNVPAVSIEYPVCTEKTLKAIEERDAAVKKRNDKVGELSVKQAGLTLLLSQAGTVFDKDERTRINGYKDEITALTDAIAELTATVTEKNEALSLRLTTADRRPPDIAALVSPAKIELTANPNNHPTALADFMAEHFETKAVYVTPAQKKEFEARKCLENRDNQCSSVTAVQKFIEFMTKVTVSAERIGSVTATDSHTSPRSNCSEETAQYFTSSNAPNLPPRCARGPISEEEKRTYAENRSTIARPDMGLIAAQEAIVYVEPSPYRFDLTAPIAGKKGEGGMRNMLDTKTIDVPQLGTHLGLPVRAGFGQKTEVKATFNEAGALITASYSSPQSSGKAAADLAKSLAGTALDARDKAEARRAKLLTDAEAAKLKAITDQSAMIEAKNKLNGLLNPVPPTVDPDADLKARVATATANALLEEAYTRIDAAQKARLN